MAEQQSEKSAYKSRFGGTENLWVTDAQYLAESMCDRQARSKGVELSVRFWRKRPWKDRFLLQLRHALSLLKLYSAEAIMRALRTYEGKRAFSLGAKWLDPLIMDEQARWLREQERLRVAAARVPEEVKSTVPEPLRPAFIEKPTPLSKLRGLE